MMVWGKPNSSGWKSKQWLKYEKENDETYYITSSFLNDIRTERLPLFKKKNLIREKEK